MPKKYVYDFEEADYKNKKLFGGKGASLIQMTRLGLRVPPGFIITTEACRDFFAPRRAEIAELEALLERQPPPEVRDQAIGKLFALINSLDLPAGLWDEVRQHMKLLEEKMGRRFGDPENPLLVSVRSGAAVSMPGMMDTVLNLGLNDQTVKGLARQTGNEWFAYDAYRRFVNMFGKIVLGIEDRLFSSIWEEIKRKYNAKEDPDVPLEGLKEAVEKFKGVIGEHYGEFPQDPWEQLRLAIKAVFRSWDSPRAIFYRVAEKITPDVADCTAVNVVTMVFGNMGWDSGTGVVFSRDVATGEDRLYGEFLPVAQGEDVVAGIRTPMDIEEFRKRFPHLYDELYKGVKLLERANKDVQDVEFTVERGKLFFLQCRNAKMTPLARVKTAVDMAKEGVISREEALLKVSPDHVLQLLYPRIDPKAKAQPIAKGLPASPGAVSGQLVFHPDDAVRWAREGKKVVLARVETKPDDVHGFYASVGILTSRGGMTSHAAVVARAIGKPAVVGAEALAIDEAAKTMAVNGQVFREGDWVTIDGNTGNVYAGVVPTVEPELIPELEELLSWADGVRRLGVRANADLPEDAALAKKFGAKGHRASEDRAHVQKAREAGAAAQGDTRRDPRGEDQAPGAPPRDAEGRLQGDIQDNGWAPRHSEAHRPAAARIPAEARRDPAADLRGQGGWQRREGAGASLRQDQGVAGGQPHVGPPRRARRRDLPRVLLLSVEGHSQGRRGAQEGGLQPRRRDNDTAGERREGD